MLILPSRRHSVNRRTRLPARVRTRTAFRPGGSVSSSRSIGRLSRRAKRIECVIDPICEVVDRGTRLLHQRRHLQIAMAPIREDLHLDPIFFALAIQPLQLLLPLYLCTLRWHGSLVEEIHEFMFALSLGLSYPTGENDGIVDEGIFLAALHEERGELGEELRGSEDR